MNKDRILGLNNNDLRTEEIRPKIEVIIGDGLGTCVPETVVHKTL